MDRQAGCILHITIIQIVKNKEHMLSFIKKISIKPVDYKQFSGEERELEREKMWELQTNSSREILIVAGEMDPIFYNENFVNIISDKLKNIPNFKVKIVFSKDDTIVDREERIKLLYKENRYLCDFFIDGKFGDRFSLYLSDRCPVYHFGIVDGFILIEKVHKHKEPRAVLLVENYKALVRKYKRYFIKQIRDNNTIIRLTFDDFKKLAA